MSIPKILSITEARGKIFDIAQKVQRPGTFFTFTEHGRAKAVIMSANEFESIKETMDVMREFPSIMEDVKRVEKKYKKGNYITLDQYLVKEGYVLADKNIKKYDVSSNFRKKSTKRIGQGRSKI